MGELRRALCGTPVHPPPSVGRLRRVFCGAPEYRSGGWHRRVISAGQLLVSDRDRDTLRSRPTEREGCTGVPQSTLRSSPIPTPIVRMPRRVFYGTGESKGGPS